MPKNLKYYYNYTYFSPIKKRKKILKLFCFILIFILTFTFNKFGLLTNITQKKYEIFKKSTYYLLLLSEDETKYTIDSLKNMGCAGNSYLNKTVLNLYINKDVCAKVEKNLQEKNIICESEKILLKGVYLNKNTNKKVVNALKNSLNTYKNALDNLIGFCEEYDSQQQSLLNIKASVNSIKEDILYNINTLKAVTNNLCSNVQVVLTNCMYICENILNCEENFASYYLKEQTFLFLQSYLKILN